MLSKYYGSFADEDDIKKGSVNKLVLDLDNKSKYVLYYKNIQLYFSLGMKLASFIEPLNLDNLIS